MSWVKIDVINTLSHERIEKLLALPPAKRRQILGGIGRELRRQSIRNIRGQHDPEGKAWAPRKRGNDRKLLRRLNRQVRPVFARPDFVEVGFVGAVAYQQHEGFKKMMSAVEMLRERKDGEKSETEPCTKRQAIALRDENYSIRIKGKNKWRKPSVSWIRANLHKKQAGLILRTLRDEGQQDRNDKWMTIIPSRTFLGATELQISKFVSKIFDNTIHSRV